MKYVSDDNKIFDTEAECKAHEAALVNEAEAREQQKKERIATISAAITDMMEFIDSLISEFVKDFPEMADTPFNIVIGMSSESDNE